MSNLLYPYALTIIRVHSVGSFATVMPPSVCVCVYTHVYMCASINVYMYAGTYIHFKFVLVHLYFLMSQNASEQSCTFLTLAFESAELFLFVWFVFVFLSFFVIPGSYNDRMLLETKIVMHNALVTPGISVSRPLPTNRARNVDFLVPGFYI